MQRTPDDATRQRKTHPKEVGNPVKAPGEKSKSRVKEEERLRIGLLSF